jgi:hypothetical protein
MSFQNPASLVLMRPEDNPKRAALLDLSFELGQEAARLGASLRARSNHRF